LLLIVAGIAATVAVSGCASDSDGSGVRPTTAQAAGSTLSDPAFEPLPGARAEYGTLGGAVFQIEIPERWNGRLVMWMHGYEELAPQARATPPDFRRFLIANGYAWAASSFSSTLMIPGRAADETAALWDHFVRTHGRPVRTYVSGLSMGGWATHISAERYGDRYDGALALCGAAGTEPGLSVSTDVLVAAAYVAGVRQSDVDASPSLQTLFDRRIRPALADPRQHERFERIVVGLTGGPRAGDRAGVHLEEETNLRRAILLASTGLAPPRTAPYALAPGSGVTSGEFNRAAIRFRVIGAAQRLLWNGTETTGRLAMPLLTLHTTGDGQVPIDQAVILRRRVAAAGTSRLLVQRVIEDVNHCGFRTGEQEAAFGALVDWVENDRRPAGTNLDLEDLSSLDRTFELGPPRPGAAADRRPGARSRAIVTGRATLDGRPFDARWIGAVVRAGKLVTPCQHGLPPIRQGRFTITVLGAAEALGCGRPGAEILLWTYAGEQKLFAAVPIRWPRTGRVRATVEFSRAAPRGASSPSTDFSGEVYGPGGVRVATGGRVEARIGSTLCGHARTRFPDALPAGRSRSVSTGALRPRRPRTRRRSRRTSTSRSPRSVGR
jgi:hypothetical protein